MARRGKPQTSSEEERRGVQSIEIGVPLLTALVEAGRPMALKDLSAAADMAPSKAHRYVASFVRCGLIAQNEATGQYTLGHSALQLGLSALSQIDLVDHAAAGLEDLSSTTGVTSLLSVWGPQGPVVVRWRRARQLLVTSLSLGSLLPVTRSATGHVFLAFLPREFTAEQVESERRADEADSSTRPLTDQQIDQMIGSVRGSMLAWADGSFIPGLRAIAAPVLDAQGEAAAVITLIGTDPYLTNPHHEAAQALIETCRSVSLNGFRGASEAAA